MFLEGTNGRTKREVSISQNWLNSTNKQQIIKKSSDLSENKTKNIKVDA